MNFSFLFILYVFLSQFQKVILLEEKEFLKENNIHSSENNQIEKEDSEEEDFYLSFEEIVSKKG